eukprot:775362-Rhodomonas_salina.1
MLQHHRRRLGSSKLSHASCWITLHACHWRVKGERARASGSGAAAVERGGAAVEAASDRKHEEDGAGGEAQTRGREPRGQ